MYRYLAAIFMLLLSLNLEAQFNNTFNPITPPGYSNQQQNQNKVDTLGPRKPQYTFKRYIKALAGKDSMKIGYMWVGSLVLPGSAQIYNREYWKLPVIYGSMGAFIYTAYKSNTKYHQTGEVKYRTMRNAMAIGAALSYWSSIMDGVVNYKYYKPVLPARASIFSAMIPGLGQAYNGDYWKIPIFYGGIITCGYFIYDNQNMYNRYRTLYYKASDANSGYDGPYSVSALKWYKDTYRRYRDYSILSGALVYALNIIDANVFAHLRNFDISDDLSMKIDPAVIVPVYPQMAQSQMNQGTFGLKMKLIF